LGRSFREINSIGLSSESRMIEELKNNIDSKTAFAFQSSILEAQRKKEEAIELYLKTKEKMMREKN